MSDFVLECRAVNHWFGKQKVLYDINLQVPRGQFIGLVGGSGCGKTTLLRAILGTHPPRAGHVMMNGQPVLSPGRDRGIVYQRYSLFPYLTALQNVAFGLMLDQVGVSGRIFNFFKWRALRKNHLEMAEERLVKLNLKRELHKYPAQLSGGQCQRVAIAQALIMQPEILLLDEPFGALDEATREDQQAMILTLHEENQHAIQKGAKPPYTIILVTHELNEAIYVADRVIALSRYWLWEETGEKDHPGASIVYDAATPPFPRHAATKDEDFRQQRGEIRLAAFEEEPRYSRDKYLRYGKETRQEKAVAAPSS